MVWAEAATPPTPVLGQGHPRLHLLISSSSAVGGRRGGRGCPHSQPGSSGVKGHVGRCMLNRQVA